MLSRVSSPVALLLGLGVLANGLVMLAVPDSWYWMTPGVAERGPFNQHFVRDIGISYALVGTAFICGVFFHLQRTWLWLLATAWLLGHAVFHGWEVVVGICAPSSLVEDFAGVTLPALLGLALVYASNRLPAD